jgi:Fe/S biogenesis protein NfuA
VREAVGGESDPTSLALWLEVTGVADGAFTYDIYFRATADADIWDSVRDDDGLSVVIPKDSIERVQGAVLDFVPGDGSEGSLVVVNPNPPPASLSDGLPHHPVDLSDPFARQVVSVLERQVNPSIAVHGGRADLEAVEGLAVYLRLSGGCQGCGMAKATLAQGIEVMLREAIPELTGVVDVTDHAGGTNPYYEPSLS